MASTPSDLSMNDAARGPGYRIGRWPGVLFTHVVLLAGAAFMLVPFVWMFTTSFRPASELITNPLNPIPRTFLGLQNFHQALSTAPLLTFMKNGVIVCAGILMVQLLVAIPAAYALAKLTFPGRSLLFALVIAGLCVPIQVPALPLYLGLAHAGLLDTYFAMMLPFFHHGVRHVFIPSGLQDVP